MGRYSSLLSAQFADFAGVQPGQRALDVGCGPGALTTELVARLGADAVAAIDPSVSFVQAARDRHPLVDIREGRAEDLPFPDDDFGAALAQLVVHFFPDPIVGLKEMQRVTRSGGVIAANVWDFAGEQSPLSIFWRAAREIDPQVHDESLLPGAREGHLRELFESAELLEVVEVALEISMEHSGFDEWWTPYTGGVGPVGSYFASLNPDHQLDLRERCRANLPPGSFVLTSRAWAARGIVG